MVHYRDTYAVIDLGAIEANIDILYQHTKKPMMAILKANAYGHGYQEVAHVLKHNHRVAMFGVATLKEAVDLRKLGIQKDILVLGAIPASDIKIVIEHDITLTLFSQSYIEELKSVYCYQKPIKAHIKIDTGMNRLGLKSKDEFEAVLTQCSSDIFDIEGVFTHFATADDQQNVSDYQSQLALFYKIIEGHTFSYIHCQNSAAMIYHHDDRSNLSRVGIAMYGVDPAGIECTHLKQAMSLYTKVVMIKKIKRGEKVGYGLTYTAQDDEYIATLPIGYADGFIRANQGREVYIQGKFYPIVGRICMDQMMVKVDKDIHVYDQVEIFGSHLSLARMANELETIPYEIICLVSERVERIYQNPHKKNSETM